MDVHINKAGSGRGEGGGEEGGGGGEREREGAARMKCSVTLRVKDQGDWCWTSDLEVWVLKRGWGLCCVLEQNPFPQKY